MSDSTDDAGVLHFEARAQGENQGEENEQVRLIQVGIKHEVSLADSDWEIVDVGVDRVPQYTIDEGSLYVTENRINGNVRSVLAKPFIMTTQDQTELTFRPVNTPVSPHGNGPRGPTETLETLRPTNQASYDREIEYDNVIVTPAGDTEVSAKYNDQKVMVEENQKETIDLASNKVNVDAFPKEEELSLDVVEEKEATVRPTLYIKNRGKLEVQFIEH